ncbi:uncharacterized protein [Primulina huaijiensis]|uniref:uncharacterized protein n=1 Tax=Primulina huaijiensis TaxID=1492673 RepID=UPI003CC6E8E8
MVSPINLISIIESSLLGQTPPTAAQRVELLHAIRRSLPSLKSVLSYPIVGHRNRLIMLLLLLTQNVMNIVLAHFQDSAYVNDYSHSMKVIAHSTQLDAEEDLHTLCGKSIPVLERFEALREDKTGQSLKIFGEIAIQKLST